ncbi:unnamed protein product [Enterobius vermicularis]|uniref:Secreted protein n=1 Tax=Enterobius vermicularis TaxID=51028 RepID=A0A0N4VRQ2_ENTVE|nr:unnamed protein product [Enterobius vermicularis]
MYFIASFVLARRQHRDDEAWRRPMSGKRSEEDLVVVLKRLVLGESFAECTMGAQVPLLRCVFVDMEWIEHRTACFTFFIASQKLSIVKGDQEERAIV